MCFLALDIGGANIKIADGKDYAASRHFELWRAPQRLASCLQEILAAAPPVDFLAVTMTGELADCFSSKTEGVEFIIGAAVQAAGQRAIKVYLTDGSWADPQQALQTPKLAAASNWRALAQYAARLAGRRAALLFDIGSTTTDIIPLQHGQPAPQGRTDQQRLLSGELVYTGVQRSPLCGLVASAPYRGRECPVAQELFATAHDIYLLSGDLEEDSQDRHTADNRPATREAALLRLGRMFSAEGEDFLESDAQSLAAAIIEAQIQKIIGGLDQVLQAMPAPPETAIISGQGEFLAFKIIERMQIPLRIVSLAEALGPKASRAAPAFALAVLAREEFA